MAPRRDYERRHHGGCLPRKLWRRYITLELFFVPLFSLVFRPLFGFATRAHLLHLAERFSVCCARFSSCRVEEIVFCGRPFSLAFRLLFGFAPRAHLLHLVQRFRRA